MKKNIAVIGAGIGGLAAAARLAHQGHSVTVYEKLPRCGGRANIIEDKGFKIDTGPSFVLMPDFYKEVFSSCGRDIADYLSLKMLDVHYKIFFPDKQTLTIYSDLEKTKQEYERIEKGAAAGLEEFLEESGKMYQAVAPLLYKSFSKKDIVNPAYWPLLKKLKVSQTSWQFAKKYFTSEKLCAAATFEAMFIGVSPFVTPAFYSVITYSDYVQKIFHPLGGMYKIPLALRRLAEENGCRIVCDCPVEAVEKNNAHFSLRTARGGAEADLVVANPDYPYVQERLLKRRIPDYKYSCSTMLFYFGLRKKVQGLYHHNIFFAPDLRKNLREIFDEYVVPQEPSFYVHVPTVTDPSLAPEAKEIIYVLIPVPNLARPIDYARCQDRLKRYAFKLMDEVTGEKLEDLVEVGHAFYPQDFIDRYNAKHGAPFGLAHTFFQSSFFRPPNPDSRLKGLYYVGCSTQPGVGVPTVMASSRIVADLIAVEHGSAR